MSADLSGVALGTVASRAFLPMARVMLSSVRTVHPGLPTVLVPAEPGLVDDLRPDDPFEVVPLESIGIPDLEAVRARYSISQLSIAAKAFLLRYLLRRGFDRAAFLDSDIEVFAPLDPLLAPPAGVSIMLTPHLLTPLRDGTRWARERNILQSGVFNGGALAVCAGDEARRFLDWWCDRLHADCRHDLAAGIHNDQRWLDLVLPYFSDVHIVRDPGCNVAYWNLPERRVEMDGDEVRVDGGPLRFFHFSGYDPATPAVATRYSSRLTIDDLGPAAALFTRYSAKISAQSALTNILV